MKPGNFFSPFQMEPGNSKWSATMKAANSGDLKKLEKLVKQEDINFSTSEKITALSLACRSGNFQVAKFLVANGADGRADRRGFSPLHWAAISGHADCLLLICEKFPGLINFQDLEGNTALHWSSRNGRDACTKILAKNFADSAVENFQGKTAAEIAEASAADAK